MTAARYECGTSLYNLLQWHFVPKPTSLKHLNLKQWHKMFDETFRTRLENLLYCSRSSAFRQRARGTH